MGHPLLHRDASAVVQAGTVDGARGGSSRAAAVRRAVRSPALALTGGVLALLSLAAASDALARPLDDVVDSGTLTAWLHLEDGKPVRIRQVLPGAALGEIAFVSGGPRTANVIADTVSVVRVLRRDHFDEVAATQPDIAIAVQQELLRRIGARLASSSAMVRDLLE